ncbi:MAG TPA: TonB-dependent receptor [Vicinamibacterales bacterium]|jgi:iron complex outermembrane receptor protein
MSDLCLLHRFASAGRSASLAAAVIVVTASTAFAQAPPTGTEQNRTKPATATQTAPGTTPAAIASPQQPDQLPRVDVEVVVTAPRMEIPLKENPAATTVITGETLESMPRGIGAEEALQFVPGVKVDNQADGERVHLSIRGQGLLTERGIRGVKVLLDGLPLNDPTGFAPDLFDVDWATVQRIEVLRGSASALYGGGSSGGVVNITTRDGGQGGPNVRLGLDAGAYSFYKPVAEVGGTSGRMNYRMSVSGNSGDGYRVHTQFNAFNAYGKLGYRPNDSTRLTFIVAGTHFYNDNAEGLNLDWLAQDRRMANPDALTYNEGQRTNRFTTGLSGQTKIADGHEVSYAVYYRRTGWWESVPSSVQHRSYDSPGGNVQYTMHSDIAPVKNHLSIGADIDWQGIGEYRHPNLGGAKEGPELLSNQDITQRGIGLYLLDRVEFNPEWSATVGLRLDRIRNELTDKLEAGGVDLSGEASFGKTTGRLGVAYNPRADIGVYASWGQGFLPPATEELANNPDHQGGFNLSLVPATSRGEEFGVRGGANGFAYDVAFFHVNTDNDFGRYRVKNRPLETFYQNAGSSRRYGLETALGYVPRPDINLRLAYTWNDFKYTSIKSLFGEFTDKVMPNAPRHQFAFDAEYVYADNWVFGLNLFAQSLSYVDQTNVASTDGFVLVNPRVAYRFGKRDGMRGEVMLSVRNLLATEYIAFSEPDPDGNSYQPGPTRELFFGVRLVLGR